MRTSTIAYMETPRSFLWDNVSDAAQTRRKHSSSNWASACACCSKQSLGGQAILGPVGYQWTDSGMDGNWRNKALLCKSEEAYHIVPQISILQMSLPHNHCLEVAREAFRSTTFKSRQQLHLKFKDRSSVSNSRADDSDTAPSAPKLFELCVCVCV